MSDDFNQSDIIELINEEFQLKFYFSKIFHAVCHRLGYQKVNDWTIDEWINILHYQINDYHKIESKYLEIMEIIHLKTLAIINELIGLEISLNNSKFATFSTIYDQLGCFAASNEDLLEIFNRQKAYSDSSKDYYLMKALEEINRVYDKLVFDMIRESIQLGETRLRVFEKIYDYFKNPPMPSEVMNEWFKKFEEHTSTHNDSINEELKIEVGNETYELIKRVYIEHRMYTTTIGYIDCEANVKNYKAFFFNSRYLFQFTTGNKNESKFELNVIDLFHGKAKHFTLDGYRLRQAIILDYLKFVRFSNNQLIIFAHVSSSTCFYLIQFDSKFKKCEIAQKQVVDIGLGSYCTMVFDELNSSTFAICDYLRDGPRNQRCIFGQFINSFSANEDDFVLFDKKYRFLRLIGRKFYGLRHELTEEDESRMFYWCREINGEIRDIFEFQLNEEFDFHIESKKIEYSWIDNICYVSEKQHSNIFAFNVDFQTCSCINFKYLKVDSSNFISNRHVLTLEDDKNYFYRINLRKPDSLIHTTWFNIRRGAIFFDRKLYRCARNLMSLNNELQPFEMSKKKKERKTKKRRIVEEED